MNKSVFLQLFRKDLLAFWRDYPSKLFDTCFLFFTNVVVMGYLMTEEWVSPSYGPFLMIGAIASFGIIEVVGKVSVLLMDIEGDKTISQMLILPIRAYTFFLYIAIFWATTSLLLSLPLFPFGKLLLFTRFDLSKISLIRLIPIYLSANLFYGFFALWLTSIIKSVNSINAIFMRAINPLWMLGAYFYSWEAAYRLSPIVGYISLLNPMVYIQEGMRAATLGQEGYLPYWVCLIAIWVFNISLALFSIQKLKRRLDCV